MPVAEIRAEPPAALVDDPIQIVVEGLLPLQDVTLSAFLHEDRRKFMSHAFYKSDPHGKVDCCSMPSLGGTFQGVEPMGLLWSMRQCPGQMPGLRLIKQVVEAPIYVDVYVHRGHVTLTSEEDVANHKEALLARTLLKRFYQSPDVVAFPVRAGAIRGMLFLPLGDGPFPGVIDMFGTVAGLNTFRAALLASRGFAALSLAYFGYEDLPPGVELRLEYFEEAVDWLHRHPFVLKNGIGVVGISKGGALALDMATRNPKVRAAVCINGPSYHISGLHSYKGEPQFVYNPSFGFRETEEGLEFGQIYIMDDLTRQNVIPVETAENADFLLIYGLDDPSNLPHHLDAIVDRFRLHGKTNYEVLSYPLAGHLIEPPYSPHFRACYSKFIGSRLVYGGKTKPHSDAQEDAWHRMLAFLWQRLTAPGDIRCHNPSKL